VAFSTSQCVILEEWSVACSIYQCMILEEWSVECRKEVCDIKGESGQRREAHVSV